MYTAAPISSARTSLELFRQEQGPDNSKLTLYEYGDRVELHRPDGIERLTPADGQTAKDVFLNRMSELLNNGYCIGANRRQPTIRRNYWSCGNS
jgi:hypothetical protein